MEQSKASKASTTLTSTIATTEQEVSPMPTDYPAASSTSTTSLKQGSAVWAFLARTTPGDLLKIISFLTAVAFAAVRLHGIVERLEDQAAASVLAVTELRAELGSVKTQLVALQVQSAAGNALLQRISEEQMELRREQRQEKGGK